MKLSALVGVALLGAILFTGCAESRSYKSYSDEVGSWSYPTKVCVTFKDWFLDATDIAGAEVGLGEGIGFDIQPTKPFEFGAMAGDMFKFGWRERSLGFWHEVTEQGGATWWYWRSLRFEPVLGTPSLFARPRLFQGFPIRYNEPYHWMDLGVEVQVIYVSAAVRASPKQALDFAITTLMLPVNLFIRPPLDCVGLHLPEIDICQDDTASHVRRKYEVELVHNPEVFEPVEKFNEIFLEPDL